MKMVRGLVLLLGAAAAALVFTAGPASAHGHGDWDDDGWNDGGMSTHHNVGLLNGNQAYVPVNIPLNFCGNSLALLGGSWTHATCVND